MRSIAALALLLIATASAPASASPLSGTWKRATTADQLATRQAEIDEAVRTFTWILRGPARSRISAKALLPNTVQIAEDADKVAVVIDDRAPTWSDLQGTPVQAKDRDGEALTVSRHWQDDALITTVTSPTGVLEMRFAAGEGGVMHVDFDMQSEKIREAPIHYRLTYRRS